MAQEASVNHILILTLVVTALLLSILPVWPARAGGGIVLRPPFDGTYRVIAYFDHEKPNYGSGADGFIRIYIGERVPASYPNKTGEPYPYDGHDGWDWSMGTGTDIRAAASGTIVWSVDKRLPYRGSPTGR
jgi:murein DD-endopeptidase MepM/ murein hydrolase activator NlpD